MRIIRTRFKLLFLGAAVVLKLLEGVTVGAVLPAIAGTIVGALFSLALVVTGVRIFRGRGESLESRALWRATAAPTAGYVIAGALLLIAIGDAAAVTIALSREPVEASLAQWIQVAALACAAIFYLQSSIRMNRARSTAGPVKQMEPSGQPEQ